MGLLGLTKTSLLCADKNSESREWFHCGAISSSSRNIGSRRPTGAGTQDARGRCWQRGGATAGPAVCADIIFRRPATPNPERAVRNPGGFRPAPDRNSEPRPQTGQLSPSTAGVMHLPWPSLRASLSGTASLAPTTCREASGFWQSCVLCQTGESGRRSVRAAPRREGTRGPPYVPRPSRPR